MLNRRRRTIWTRSWNQTSERKREEQRRRRGKVARRPIGGTEQDVTGDEQTDETEGVRSKGTEEGEGENKHVS